MDGHPAQGGQMQHLPSDVVQHIFSLKDLRGGTVIPLDQRLRCLLVSKAWRAALGPGALPVPLLSIDAQGAEARALAMAEWACRVQPQVEAARLSLIFHPSAQLVHRTYAALLSLHPRTALAAIIIHAESDMLGRFLPELRLFPQLRSIDFFAYWGLPGISLGSEFAAWLPQLEELELRRLSLALEGGTPAFTALAGLTVIGGKNVCLTATLPQLQQLDLSYNSRVRLAGGSLPALTRLTLCAESIEGLEVDFGIMPALVALELRPALRTTFAATCSLTGLTLLDLYGPDPDIPSVLAAAAPSLRRLGLFLYDEEDLQRSELEAAVGCLQRLTALECWNWNELLPLLPAKAQLRELRLCLDDYCTRLNDIPNELGSFPGLEKVAFERQDEEEGEEDELWLEMLREIVPAGCEVSSFYPC